MTMDEIGAVGDAAAALVLLLLVLCLDSASTEPRWPRPLGRAWLGALWLAATAWLLWSSGRKLGLSPAWAAAGSLAVNAGLVGVVASRRAVQRERGHTPRAAAAVKDNGDQPLRVIIGGYGPIGRVAADRLEKMGAAVTIVDLNQKTVRTHTQFGRSVVLGDLSDPAVLESAGVRDADALILTTPDEAANLRSCGLARAANPGLCIVVRTAHLSSGLRAKGLGADAIVVEEVAAAEAMEKVVTARFAVNTETPSRG